MFVRYVSGRAEISEIAATLIIDLNVNVKPIRYLCSSLNSVTAVNMLKTVKAVWIENIAHISPPTWPAIPPIRLLNKNMRIQMPSALKMHETFDLTSRATPPHL